MWQNGQQGGSSLKVFELYQYSKYSHSFSRPLHFLSGSSRVAVFDVDPEVLIGYSPLRDCL